uniref:Uncharacterized protein n=1 Tax=Setaria digitata TaxID=48799 RepID=A0A915PF86_9BILA
MYFQFPPFLEKLPVKAKDEFCAMYEKEMEMSKNQLHDKLQKFAAKYGVERAANKLIKDGLEFEKKRYEVLTERLRKVEGDESVKKIIVGVLKLQQKMDMPLGEMQEAMDKLTSGVVRSTEEEIVRLWNMICPDDIHGTCK